MTHKTTATHIAMVCHEANRAFCTSYGDFSQPSWHEATAEIRESAYNGVVFALDNPNATPEMQHESWCADKIADGWKYGEVKDPVAKTHPCLVGYTCLPEYQKKKDSLFQAIVNALK